MSLTLTSSFISHVHPNFFPDVIEEDKENVYDIWILITFMPLYMYLSLQLIILAKILLYPYYIYIKQTVKTV